MTAVRPTPPDVAEQGHDHRRLIAIAVLLLIVASTPLWLWWRASRSTAAFADAEVLKSNRLGAATLDVEIGESTVTFEAVNLAPGDAVSAQLELENVGTLPLRFVVSGQSDGDLLADWLRFDMWRATDICRADDPGDLLVDDVALTPATALLLGDDALPATTSESALAVGDSTIVCLGARLLLEAPNDVQGRRTEIDLIVDAVHDIEAEQ